VIQKVCASRVEGKGAGTIFVPGGECKRTAQICVEVHDGWHRSQIARDVSIHRVCGQSSKGRTVNPLAWSRCIRWPVTEISIPIRIGARSDVVGRAVSHIEDGGELQLARKVKSAGAWECASAMMRSLTAGAKWKRRFSFLIQDVPASNERSLLRDWPLTGTSPAFILSSSFSDERCRSHPYS
jgi:hypothetical protein